MYMALGRVDVSLRRRIHFHGFGVARQGPWDTVEKVGVELITSRYLALKAPKAVCLVSDLGRKRAPGEFFNTLRCSRKFGTQKGRGMPSL